MKKIIMILFSIYFTASPVFSTNTSNLVQKRDIKEIYFDPSTDSYKFSQTSNGENLALQKSKTIYVKIKKEELDLLRREAFISKDILDRLSDLEKLYRTIKGLVEGIIVTVDVVKKLLNITDKPSSSSHTDANEFELPSGMVLSPGFISYTAKFYDPTKNFDSLAIKALDFDIFYNKTLFTIDHIEGDGVYGNQFKFISLPQSSSTSKDRIQVPLSNIVAKEAKFEIYFAPRNVNLAKLNDTSEIEIKDYKRPVKDPNGNNVSPVVYELGLSSPDFIKITKK